MIKAIETNYKGYRFRSRLEARWAVFFDALGITWQYEPEGFELPSGERYLPDFFLPRFHTDYGIYVEVKNVEGSLQKPRMLAMATGWPVLLAVGEPDLKTYELAVDTPGQPKTVCFTWRSMREQRLWEEPCEHDLNDEDVRCAVAAARGARFEHGESPNAPRRQAVATNGRRTWHTIVMEVARTGMSYRELRQAFYECPEVRSATVEVKRIGFARGRSLAEKAGDLALVDGRAVVLRSPEGRA